MAGFSILVFSNFYPTIYFGAFTALAMFIALVGSLTILPILLGYFNKNSSELSIGEAALLAGLLKAPSRYSPINNKKLSQARALTVLKIMRDQKLISIKDFNKAAKALPTIEKNNINEIGSYYADWIMQDAPQEITKQRALSP